MDLPPLDSSGSSGPSSSGSLGSSGDAPAPPFSLGDPLALSSAAASTEALRGVLARHRRRQLQVLGGVLAVALLAGSIAGFAIGRQGRAGVTRLAAGSQPTDQAALSSGVAGVSSPNVPSATMVTGKGAIQSNQVLVRNAKDGTRVRLYEETFQMPPVQPPCNNSGNKACPEIAVGNAAPNKTLLAEVSDDQVAGQVGTPQWDALKTAGFDPLAAEVVGMGQPQPILVVLAHAPANVTTVDVTTPYGSDSAAPGPGGWVALAVRLPADYASEKLPSDPSVQIGIPSGTVTARSASGASVDSVTLAKLATKMFSSLTCDSAAGAAKARSAVSNEAGTNSAGPAGAPAAGTKSSGKPSSASGSSSASPSASGGTTGSAAGSAAAGSNSSSGVAKPPPGDAAPPAVSCGSYGIDGTASTGAGSSGSASSSAATVPAPATPASPATP